MRMFLVAVAVAVAFLVVFPGVVFAQLAPQSQAEFEQRFTGWTLLSTDDADCGPSVGLDFGTITFTGPGRVEGDGLMGDYEYEGTGANTGTLTLRLTATAVLDLTFNSQTIGTYGGTALGFACEGGSFEFYDPAVGPTPDTTPPMLISAEVDVEGDGVDLTFDELITITSNPVDFFDNSFSITADGQPVRSRFQASVRDLVRLQLLTPIITRGQEVIVTYEDPTPGDDDWGLSDVAGNDAGSFNVVAVNNSTVEATPVLPLAGAALLGMLLVAAGIMRRWH